MIAQRGLIRAYGKQKRAFKTLLGRADTPGRPRVARNPRRAQTPGGVSGKRKTVGQSSVMAALLSRAFVRVA